MVVAGVGGDVGGDGVGYEGGRGVDQAVGGDGDALVVAIQEIEGFGDEVEFVALAEAHEFGEAEVGGGVVGAGEGVAGVAGETVVEVVAVLVGVAGDGGVEGASAAVVDDAGNFPVVEDVAKKWLAAMKRVGLGGDGGDQALALIGDARSALGTGVVGILDGRGLVGDQGVLAIVDGMGIGVREAEISSAGDAAIDGERGSVVVAGGGALEFVDGAELRDGAAERVDARREGARQRAGELPGGEGIDGVIAALEDGAGGIENGISESGGLHQVYVERADQVFSVNTEQ